MFHKILRWNHDMHTTQISQYFKFRTLNLLNWIFKLINLFLVQTNSLQKSSSHIYWKMSFLKNLGSKPLQMTESLPINKESKVCRIILKQAHYFNYPPLQDLEEMRVYISTLSKKLKKETKNISCKMLFI